MGLNCTIIGMGVHFSYWESVACLLVREEGCNLLDPISKSIPNKSKSEKIG